MKRYIMPAIALVLVLALAGVAGINYAQGTTAQLTGQMGPGDHTRLFPELQGIPPDQLFDHFMGAQFTMTDAQGVQFTVNMIPGTVSSIGATSITITPNGQTTTETFNVTPDTVVRGMPGRGSFQAIVQGDKVVVMTKGTSQDAVMIAKHGALYHQRMMDSMMD